LKPPLDFKPAPLPERRHQGLDRPDSSTERFLENFNVNSAFAITTLRAATLTLALTLAACSSLDGLMSGDKLDYKTKAVKVDTLEVPPDLSQLARDGRYQPQSGVVSASNMRQAGNVQAAAAPVAMPALSSDMRIERQGNSRWLVTSMPPETLFPLLRTFWKERGFVLVEDNAEIGLMETNWAENRAKIPMDFIRGTIGRIFDNAFSSSERDRYRTRVERTATGSEVYISHRGVVEVYDSIQRVSTVWQARPTDPELEAEFLTRLMVRLGAKDDLARATVANASAPPPKARGTAAASSTMELDQAFDRAWRQVGLALDRSGFTVEDRDRSAGMYFVRYIDPKLAGKEEPNFFMKFFSSDKDAGRPQRYRVLVKAAGAKTQVSMQNSQGAADDSAIARQIIGRLIDELR
jgi:outer membrane protein assembly factor BamC